MNDKYLDKCYIGYTPNPLKRIRMHNGQISGGARKTHNGRPWEMILFVSGFPNKIAGLKFEYILTYPTRSKYYSIINDKQQRIKPVIPNKIKSAMDMLIYILTYKPYRNQPLTINFLSKQYYDQYSQVFINLGFRTQFLTDFLVDKQKPVLADQIYKFQLQNNSKCALCKKQVNYTCVKCPYCGQQYCLSCLGGWLSQQSNELIPTYGNCFTCQKQIVWKEILYNMQDEIIKEKLNNQIDQREQVQLSTSQSNSDDDIQSDLNQDYLKQQTTPSFKANGNGLIDLQLMEQQFNNSIDNDNETLKISDLDINALKVSQTDNDNKTQTKQQISISISSSSTVSIN